MRNFRKAIKKFNKANKGWYELDVIELKSLFLVKLTDMKAYASCVNSFDSYETFSNWLDTIELY